jgi:methyltransferase (TIGR00027 family)
MSTPASKTALMVAAYRGRASARKDAICNDPFANALAGDDGAALAAEFDQTFPHMELWMAVRTAFFDERVRRMTAGSDPTAVRQVVLLGAGFDTRAARLARDGVRFFEVDRPSSQASKLERLATLEGYPIDAATYVTCDFEHEDFVDRLATAGFAPDRPALLLWEGVTPYLSETAVRATLRRVAQGTHPESVIVFDHVRPKMVSGDVRDQKDLEPRAMVADLGEPLRFGIEYALPLLYEEGFRRVRTLTFDEACLDVTGTYERERAFRFQGIAMATRAARELL